MIVRIPIRLRVTIHTNALSLSRELLEHCKLISSETEITFSGCYKALKTKDQIKKPAYIGCLCGGGYASIQHVPHPPPPGCSMKSANTFCASQGQMLFQNYTYYGYDGFAAQLVKNPYKCRRPQLIPD